MEIIKKSDNQLVFSADMEESLANSIRRYLNQISILAIDEVEIAKNDSALYDETIAHRLSLIPIKMDKLVKQDETVKFKLSVKGEGKVYSEELKGGREVAYGKEPITSLEKGQELELVAVANIGKGNEHSKFSPGLMFYRELVDVKVDKDCPREVVDKCPKKILQFNGGSVQVKDSLNCDMCDSCVEFCKKKGKDSIRLVPTGKLVVTLESFGQLDVKDMFKKTIEALKKDLAEVNKKVGK